MNKDNKNNLKLMKLYELLMTESDENHPMTTRTLCERLARIGIPCDRRTLSRNIRELGSGGFEIMSVMQGHSKAYYVEDRKFSIPEIRILIDAVQASRFITEKKSDELIRKLAAFAGSYRAEVLTGSMLRFNSRKHSNEYIYYTVDALGAAIQAKRKASFLYFDLDENRKRVYRRNGERYTVEPVTLVLNDDNYYLICHSDIDGSLRHYRVDRMEAAEVEDMPVSDGAMKQMEHIPEHTAQLFRMFGGEPQEIRLEFERSVMGAVYDQFGEGTEIAKAGDRFAASVTVQISPTFWGWVLQFGDRLRITAPENLAKRQRAIVRAMNEN